jgi:hypothetical protein
MLIIRWLICQQRQSNYVLLLNSIVHIDIMRKTSLGYPFLLKTVSTKPVTFAQRIVLSLIGIFLLTMQVSRGQYIETSKLYQVLDIQMTIMHNKQ